MTVLVHRARHIWLGPGRWLSPGELVVDHGRIVAVRAATSHRVPDRVLLPAFVNAHVHLQLAPLARPVRRFVPWIRAILKARLAQSETHLQAQAAAALDVLQADGVASVGEIDATGFSPAVLRSRPLISGRCYQEVVGFDLGPAGARDLLARRRLAGTVHCAAGLSPHAPYSVSPALLRAVRDTRVATAIHVAETEEEVSFLRSGRGPFRDLLEELGKLPLHFTPPGCGPVEWLYRRQMLSKRSLLVHAQHMTPAEADLAAQRGAPVVVCPGTIRYFRRPPPPVASWLLRGIVVALGTDSLASNECLSMRSELALASQLWPQIDPELLLAMATLNGAVALARRTPGRLQRGGAASFLSVEVDATDRRSGPRATIERLVATGGRGSNIEIWLRGVVIDGRETSTRPDATIAAAHQRPSH